MSKNNYYIIRRGLSDFSIIPKSFSDRKQALREAYEISSQDNSPKDEIIEVVQCVARLYNDLPKIDAALSKEMIAKHDASAKDNEE